MDLAQQLQQRFQGMLMSAELAAERSAQERPGILQSPHLMVASTKAMNQAVGFLEAVSIAIPELGPELLDEFEAIASRLESLAIAIQANGDRRRAGAVDDRRVRGRRLGHDRRNDSIAIAVERRLAPNRRGRGLDRRTGKIRDLADRRWRAIQH